MPDPTSLEKAESLAGHLRVQVHPAASVGVRPLGTSMVFEIEILSPGGARLIAFSHEWLDDHTVYELKRQLNRMEVAEALISKEYLPVLITNDGVRPYTR